MARHIISMPKPSSFPLRVSSLFMTESSIVAARNTFITSLLSPLLNSAPTIFSLAQR